jgi:prevent-host-death family protein
MTPQRVTVRELRHDTSRLLDQIQQGASVEVTRRGEVVALIVPPDADRQLIESLERDGVLPTGWQDAQRELRQEAPGPVYAPAAGSSPAEQAISDARDEQA